MEDALQNSHKIDGALSAKPDSQDNKKYPLGVLLNLIITLILSIYITSMLLIIGFCSYSNCKYLFRHFLAVQRTESSAMLEYKAVLKIRETKTLEEINTFTFDRNLKWFLCHSCYCLNTANPGSCITGQDSINSKHGFRTITGRNFIRLK